MRCDSRILSGLACAVFSLFVFAGLLHCGGGGSKTEDPVAPVITTHPADRTVNVGQTATFNVVATGTGPLTYQWKKNGASVGGNSASYTTSATTLVDDGARVSVVVTNSVKSTTSSEATLTVTDPGTDPGMVPIIAYSPSSCTFTIGIAITAMTPTSTGGSVASWSILPALPSGLSFNPNTGAITGTPEVTVASGSHVVTASNGAGTDTATIVITVHAASSASQIIADHMAVADFDTIPARYLAEAKKMMVNFPGESHSYAYRRGMELLEETNAIYACHVGTGEAPTDQYVRVNQAGAGEAIWYTWYAYDGHNGANNDEIKNSIADYAHQGHPMNVIGFGWCWDTSWTQDPGGTVDPVYKVRWAGASDGGPDGNQRWGLDAGDAALTGNRVCMDTYLEATESYRTYCLAAGYPTVVVFTTSPVDSYSGENGYQRQLKHEYIRNYVKADATRVLFDYADILCHNDDGSQNLISWTDGEGGLHVYPVITAANLGDASIGHIGSAGAIRLAKAQWWLLARLAGWDGVSQ